MQYNVSCLVVGLTLTFLHSVFSEVKRPQADKREGSSFISPDGRFSFNYAKPIVSCTRDSKQSDLWIPVESCEAYIPVCSDFSGIKDKSVACVAYPKITMKGTNFEAAAFSVSQTDATTMDGCLNIVEANVRPARKETVNGVTFTVFDTDGVALGNSMAGEAYRSFHQNKCYELDIRVASANIGAFDPGTVREFDSEAVYRVLKSVLNSFRFLK